MIKQVDEMPTEGKFSAVWECSDGSELISGDFYYDDEGDLVWVCEDSFVSNSNIDFIKKGIFFVREPQLTTISFNWPWQVEQWLHDSGKKLFVENDVGSEFVVWSSAYCGGKCVSKNRLSSVKYNNGSAKSHGKTNFYYLDD